MIPVYVYGEGLEVRLQQPCNFLTQAAYNCV
jgi:hypothetical protein